MRPWNSRERIETMMMDTLRLAMSDAYLLPALLLLSLATVAVGGSLWLPATLFILLMLDLAVTLLRRL